MAIFARMQKLYTICKATLLIIALACTCYSSNASAIAKETDTSTSNNVTSVAKAFSSHNGEIELVVHQVVVPTFYTVEKREPIHFIKALAALSLQPSSPLPITASAKEVLLENILQLLFPFHHFW